MISTILLLLSFAANPKSIVPQRMSHLWRYYAEPPADPTVSCFLGPNNQTYCALDIDLLVDIDLDDSY